jgi:preprotein translocase subunit SecB
MTKIPAPSQLECKAYFVTSLSLHASIHYKAELPIALVWEDLCVDSDIAKPDEKAPVWQVTLKVAQNFMQGKNVPYDFSIEIVGLFDIAKIEGIEIKDPEKFVRVNGSSLLFGVAREIIRSNTAAGPYASVLLPTVNFCSYQKIEELKVAQPKAIEQTPNVPQTKKRPSRKQKTQESK